MKRSTWIVWGVLAATVGASRQAEAQVWLQDRTLQEGRGVRTGNFELHPGFGVELGYDSNVFYEPSVLQPNPALRIRATPSLSLSTLGPQRSANSDSAATALPTVNFRGGVALIYYEWIGLGGADRVSRLRNLGAQANLRLELFPQRTWQFALTDEFTRTIQPGPELPDVPPAAGDYTFNRNYNHATAELAYAPGRGVFDFRLGYGLNVSIFDSTQLDRYNYLQHEIFLRNRWRFLPKTALVWEANATPLSYTDPRAGGTVGTNGVSSSTPVSTRFGINGLITERIAVMALVGYGATFFEQGDNTDTVIGQAELRWLVRESTNLKVGFLRDLQNSFFGNFFVRNRGYANYSQSFGGRFLLSLDAGLAFLQYGYVADFTGARLPLVAGADSVTGRFSAVRVEASAFGEYRFSDVFGINATLKASANISDVSLGTQPINWSRFEAFLGARVNW